MSHYFALHSTNKSSYFNLTYYRLKTIPPFLTRKKPITKRYRKFPQGPARHQESLLHLQLGLIHPATMHRGLSLLSDTKNSSLEMNGISTSKQTHIIIMHNSKEVSDWNTPKVPKAKNDCWTKTEKGSANTIAAPTLLRDTKNNRQEKRKASPICCRTWNIRIAPLIFSAHHESHATTQLPRWGL